jgi:hypothetical protein
VNKRKVALGPGAASLILIVVVLSLAMLAMLMQISSRNDVSLTSRSAEMIARVYDLNADAERKLADLDEILIGCREEIGEGGMEAYLELIAQKLPAGYDLLDDEVTWMDPLDNRIMTCTVKILPPDEKERTEWIAHKLVVEEPEDDWEW